jgi:hypothetical protein
MKTYFVFERSARGWEDFERADKRTIQEGLSQQEARAFCKDFNDHRSPLQIEAGTKWEYQAE